MTESILKDFTAKGTAQKMKFSIKGFFSKCDQIHKKLYVIFLNNCFVPREHAGVLFALIKM